MRGGWIGSAIGCAITTTAAGVTVGTAAGVAVVTGVGLSKFAELTDTDTLTKPVNVVLAETMMQLGNPKGMRRDLLRSIFNE